MLCACVSVSGGGGGGVFAESSKQKAILITGLVPLRFWTVVQEQTILHSKR